MGEDLEGIVEESRPDKAKKWLHDKKWQISKGVFGSYLTAKAYLGIMDLFENLNRVSDDPAKRGAEMHSYVVRPAIEGGWNSVFKAVGLTLLTYHLLSYLRREINDEDIAREIDEWKKIHEGKTNKIIHELSIAARSLAFTGVMLAIPLAVHSLFGTLEQKQFSLLLVAYLVGLPFLGVNWILHYTDHMKKDKVRGMFEMASCSLEGVPYIFAKKYELLLKANIRFSHIFKPSMRKIRSNLAGSLIKLGKYEDAMELYQSEIENFDIIEHRSFSEVIAEYLSNTLSKMIGYGGDLEESFAYLPQKPSAFLRSMKRVAERSDSIDVKALNALAHSKFYKGKDREEKTRKLWGEVVDAILNDPKVDSKFQILDESAHEVLEYSPQEDKFLTDVLVFKKGERLGLEQEREWTLHLKNALVNNSRYQTTIPIGIFEHNGSIYVMKRNPGTKLSEIEENKDLHYNMAGEFLAIIHSVMPTNLVSTDYIKELERRLSNCPIFDKERAFKILEVCSDIFHDFNDLPRVFIKDFHGDNIIVSGSSETKIRIMTAMDFDYKGIGYPGFDTAKLLEQGRVFPNTPEGNTQRQNVLDRYVFAVNEGFGGPKIPSSEEFVLNHFRSTILKALSYYCFSFDKPQKEQVRTDFVGNMGHAISTLKEDFGEHYRKLGRQYETLNSLIGGIPLSNEAITKELN